MGRRIIRIGDVGVAGFLVLTILFSGSTTTSGFQSISSSRRHYHAHHHASSSFVGTTRSIAAGVNHHHNTNIIRRKRDPLTVVSGSRNSNNDNNDEQPSVLSKRQRAKAIAKSVKRGVLAAPRLFGRVIRSKRLLHGIVAAVLLTSVIRPVQPAQASAPVMALPKAEDRDPATEAILEHNRRMVSKQQEQLDAMARKAREIEASQGAKARIRFEKEYKEAQTQAAEAKKADLEKLKRTLLDQGIDPFTDIEGQRQVTLHEKGVDLGKVSGTQMYLEKELEQNAPKKSLAFKKAVNRKVVACMVQDLKNRDIDPLDYFEKRQEQTMKVMDLPAARAAGLLKQYEVNLEQYGQITVPKEGEMSALEKMKQKKTATKDSSSDDPAAKKAARAEARRVKAEERAKLKEEKARVRAEAKAAKEAAKQDAKRVKEEAKAAKMAVASVGAAAGVAGSPAAGTATSVVTSGVDSVVADQSTTDDSVIVAGDESTGGDDTSEGGGGAAVVTAKPAANLSPDSSSKKSLPIVPVAAVLAVAGGGYGIKIIRERAAEDEAERQRQFRLLMGEDVDGDASGGTGLATPPALEEEDMDLSALDAKPASPAAKKKKNREPENAAPAKKRRLGLNVFGKKKNERETDLNALVGPDANAPEFATLLAKILTFGAPGRFPDVLTLPGDMPMQEFELDPAKQQLVDSRTSCGIATDESAEIFANVVNCMLIDIVDLASSSLREQNDNATVAAINIVVDFMNHAASLYDAVAEDITITPVTYGGDLPKGKLEQMYSTYSASAMTDMENIPENFDARLGMLQDVFSIPQKKAEGLMMKALQKNMVNMMKSGEGIEGMMKGMGMEGLEGLAGMPGMGADGEAPDPEQVKEMLLQLKTMKESGTLPPEEFESIKKQFKEGFGSSIEDVMKDVKEEEIDSGEKELLELMKSILDD